MYEILNEGLILHTSLNDSNQKCKRGVAYVPVIPSEGGVAFHLSKHFYLKNYNHIPVHHAQTSQSFHTSSLADLNVFFKL